MSLLPQQPQNHCYIQPLEKAEGKVLEFSVGLADQVLVVELVVQETNVADYQSRTVRLDCDLRLVEAFEVKLEAEGVTRHLGVKV